MMRKLIFLLITLLSVNLFATEKLFISADSLYQENNFEQAIEVYQTILDQKIESGELYYNLGICYFQLQKFSKSKGNFRKSLTLNPSLKIAEERIRQCNIKLNLRERPKLFYNIWWNNITDTLSIKTWVLISLCSIITMIVLIIIKLVLKKKLKNTILFYLFIFNLLLFIFTQSKLQKENEVLGNNYLTDIPSES